MHTPRNRCRTAATIAAMALVVPAVGWASTNPFDAFSGSTDRGTSAVVSDHGNILALPARRPPEPATSTSTSAPSPKATCCATATRRRATL